MPNADLIINPTWILPIEPANTILENQSLVVKDGVIIDILAPDLARDRYQAKETLTLSDHIVLPGFINAHTHTPMTLFRGIANDLPLMEWLNKHLWPAEKKWLSESFVEDAVELSIAEMIKGGTTCFNEHHFFPEAIAKITEKNCMRASIGFGIIGFSNNWAKNPDEAIKKGLATYRAYINNPLIDIVLAPHSPYTVDDNTFLKIKEISHDLQIPIYLHLHETVAEINDSLTKYNKRPIKRLYELGVLSSSFEAVHMTQLNDEDFSIIKETGLQIITCTESNLKLASGICPVQKLLDMGINVALGTDSTASNNDLDMLAELRTTSLIGKFYGNNPTHIPAITALEMATINGAKAMGLDAKVGSLKIGKAADLIAIDLADISTQPVYDPIAQIVYAANSRQVKYVWVAGIKLLDNGQLTKIDEKELIAKAKNWQKLVINYKL
jgi:5-methylthioadenosine/S-adenosylhomocysteine deaminase